MPCPVCKAENNQGAKFCNECGIRLELRCPYCEAPSGAGAKFCSECGSNLDFRCLQCSSANRPGAKFCQACGVRLVTVCFACHTPTPPGSKFCQECGTRLERRCGQCGSPLAYGAKFCNGCGGKLAEGAVATVIAPPLPITTVPIVAPIPVVEVTPQVPVEEPVSVGPHPDPLPEGEGNAPEPPEPDGGAPAAPSAPAASPRAPERGPAMPVGASAVAVAPPPTAAPAAPEDERRLVTVLFGDVSGFTAMSEKLDPEEMKMIMDRCLKGLADQVYKFEGTVDKFEGDLIMAVFGAPIAHEDDAERAVLAALDMQEFLGGFSADLQRRKGYPLKMRIGVNTGEVISGVVAEGRAKDYTVMGDVVNTASRFESSAEPGTVMVGTRTYSMTKHMIDYQELDPIMVKGKVEQLMVYRPLGIRKDRGQRRGIAGLESPMIGRGDYLETLVDCFQETVESANPHLATILAPAGMGKSRLLEEFERYLKSDGSTHAWFKGRSLPYGQGIAFHPLAEIMKGLLGIKESDTLDAVQERLVEGAREILERAGDDTDHHQVAHRLGYTMGVSFPDSDLAAINPANLKDELFWGWRKFLAAWAKVMPLVLVIEDVHWADDLVIRLMESVVDSLEGPILFMCLSRPDLLEQRPDWGQGERRSTVQLDPLSREETLQLIDNLLSPNLLSKAWKERVAEAAGGVPYYLEECIRILIEDNRLVRGPAGWAPSDSERLPELPDSIFATLSARLDKLPSMEKTLVQRAAVVGSSFWESALSYPAMHLGTEADSLDGLQAHGWVEPIKDSSFDGDPEYAFANLLVRDSAYRGLTRLRRSQEHMRVGEWLEWKLGERAEESVELLSYHFGQGVLQAFESEEEDPAIPLKATTYAWRAAERSRIQHAFRAALAGYDTTYSLLERISRLEGTSGLKIEGYVLDALRFEVLLSRARVKEPLGQYDSALEDLELVLQDPSDARSLAQVARAHSHKARILRLQSQQAGAIENAEKAFSLYEQAGDPQGEAEALINIGEIYSDQARMADLEATARRATDFARESGVLWVEARALTLLGSACIYQGKMGEAGEHLGAAVSRYEEISDRRGMASSLLLLGRVLHADGRSAEALSRLEQSYGIFQELGDQSMRTAALATLGQLCLERGQVEEARAYSEQGAALSKLLGLAAQQVRCLLLMAQASLAEGQARDAVDGLLEAKEICESSDQAAILPEVYRLLGQAYLEAGEPEAAEEFARKGREVVEEDDTYSQGTTWFSLALVLAGLQRPEEAEEAFTEAVKYLEESGETYEIGEVHLEYGAFVMAHDRKDEAAEHLRQAQEAFASLETQDRLERVEALQKQL